MGSARVRAAYGLIVKVGDDDLLLARLGLSVAAFFGFFGDDVSVYVVHALILSCTAPLLLFLLLLVTAVHMQSSVQQADKVVHLLFFPTERNDRFISNLYQEVC